MHKRNIFVILVTVAVTAVPAFNSFSAGTQTATDTKLELPKAGQEPKPRNKTFIDYFLPTPIMGSLSTTVWGAPTVGPRDQQNGLEDTTMKKWDYWDGQIIKGSDGRYHLFASRWDQANGHKGWGGSKAVHAVSDQLTGPYIDQGLCWPGNLEGKGHNVTALVLPDDGVALDRDLQNASAANSVK